jgi:hypothetical protein
MPRTVDLISGGPSERWTLLSRACEFTNCLDADLSFGQLVELVFVAAVAENFRLQNSIGFRHVGLMLG